VARSKSEGRDDLIPVVGISVSIERWLQRLRLRVCMSACCDELVAKWLTINGISIEYVDVCMCACVCVCVCMCG